MSSLLAISTCTFYDCTATNYGGGVYCESNIDLDRCCHYHNVAYDQGCSVSKMNPSNWARAKMVTICQCGDETTDQDSLMLYSSNVVRATHVNSTLNTANKWGAGWTLIGIPCTITFSQVRQCQSMLALFYGGTSGTDSCVFIDNPIPAFRCGWGGTFSFSNCLFRDSWGWSIHDSLAQTYIVSDSVIVGYYATSDGEKTATLSNCKFEETKTIVMIYGCEAHHATRPVYSTIAIKIISLLCPLLLYK